ncbi:MAG: hypothetical protein SGILL_002375 [Bacillariaceae sp.]
MGDVAQILGTAGGGGAAASSSNVPKSSSATTTSSSAFASAPNKALKMSGISKEVMDLLVGQHQDPSSADLPPIVPTFFKGESNHNGSNNNKATTDTTTAGGEVNVKIGTKVISSGKRARPWTWAPFLSSSRTDGATFNHWVRANVEYTDYPYAKFDIHLDPVIYTVEEYQDYLQDKNWTKSETDKLMELSRTFELRWPVIYDRWYDHSLTTTNSSETETPAFKLEDLQARYYGVAAKLSQARIAQEAAQEVQTLSAAAATTAQQASAATEPRKKEELQNSTESLVLEAAAARSLATSSTQHQPLINHLGTGANNKIFDLSHERERRQHIDRLWHRSKEDEKEELELRKELRVVEAQLRKLKKSGGHLLAAAATSGGGGGGSAFNSALNSAASSRNPSRSQSPVPAGMEDNTSAALDQSFASTAPVPMPNTPYLQSGRLVPPATGPNGINKSLLVRMDEVLKQLKMPPRPMPTKRVCDLYDVVRKDILTLVTLQKLSMQREGTLQSKRVKLAKLGGNSLPVEDRALDEEKLLGIVPPPPKPAPTPASASHSKPKVTKKKAAPGGAGKKMVKKGPAADTDAPTGSKAGKDAGTSGKKKVVKRKRKVVDAATSGKAPRGKAAPTTKTPPPAAGSTSAKKRARKS